MPTTRPRHVIVETREVAAALADAAARRPELRSRPGELLARLVAEGHRALRASAEDRRAAVEATAGQFGDVLGGAYLADLRKDWPP